MPYRTKFAERIEVGYWIMLSYYKYRLYLFSTVYFEIPPSPGKEFILKKMQKNSFLLK